jgi:putative spermidine/putrescine transport system substrate-binding protein
MVQQLVSGETKMAILLSGRVAAQIKQDQPLGIVWKNQIIAPDSYMVPKGAPNTEAAMKLLNTMTDTDKLVAFAKKQFYGPATEAARQQLADDPDCSLINTCGDNAADAVLASDTFWTAEEKNVSAAWDKLLGR